jgi:2-polyprenyl-3-methyl-5-hydroxy-6-metoxy-1,4-benzoquinol methylase/GNAT superfamily N-acetyltransferase
LSTGPNYEYRWIPGGFVRQDLLEELSTLYSGHYGVWGVAAEKPFQPIRLSAERIRRWLLHSESRLAFASLDGRVVGYAIAVQPKVPRLGVVSWVTQLVVHADHRHRDVGKRLLYSIWEFSDHFAWGLVTANPYAVRALEKATRRRCSPQGIARHCSVLLPLAARYTPYLPAEIENLVDGTTSRVNTEFLIDHTELPYMLEDVIKPETPWTLGELPEGWEWLAFTFREQQEIGLSETEIESMLQTSDAVAKYAYSRMRLDASHAWAKHTAAEVELIIRECRLKTGSSVLDIGCGTGRHVLELAKHGVRSTGIDYLAEAVEGHGHQPDVEFRLGDARDFSLGKTFDAVLCLYDVVGSFTDVADNERIISSVRQHLRPGGRALISVMNLDLTYRRARHRFSLRKKPNRLLELPASNTMEATGNVFNPDYYMIDEVTDIVYRKEQFTKGHELPVQLLVRDRRYRRADIIGMCMKMGLNVLWSRYVRAGQWDVELGAEDDNAKEILLLCEHPG